MIVLKDSCSQCASADVDRLFGTTGYCSACSKLIPAFEMIMKARNNVYHLECFACQRCSQRSELYAVATQDRADFESKENWVIIIMFTRGR